MLLITKIQATELKGSEVQVKWAKQIRKKKLEDFKKMGIRQLAIGLRPHVTEELFQEIKCNTPEKMNTFTWMVAYAMFGETSAKWWLDNREEPIWKWIGPAVAQTFEKCRNEKTFK